MIGWIILLLLDFLLYCFISFKSSFFFFIFLSVIYIWKMGLFRGIAFSSTTFTNCEIFYIEYIGDYCQIYREFEKLNLIINKFNLSRNTYSTFGIYYDDPKKVEASKCRAIIGILKDFSPAAKTSTREEDFIDYLVKNNFKKATLPDTECVSAAFPYNSPMSMVVGINKFYSTLKSSLQSEEFKQTFNIDRKKFKSTVEVYSKNTVYFFIPIKNHDRFNLHSIKDNSSNIIN